MCEAKPGRRCLSHSEADLARARRRYVDALGAYTKDPDDPTVQARAYQCAQELFDAQMEAAAARARAGAEPTAAGDVSEDWHTNVAHALNQTHRDQQSLMPAHPGEFAPGPVKDAYYKLGAARDRLARHDAMIAADEQTPLNGHPQPGPALGQRPSVWNLEQDVAAAEYNYAQAIHPGAPSTTGEQWRTLLTSGQMPYEPFANPHHPPRSEAAPWVRYARPAAAVDVPSLRRSSGLYDDVYFDTRTDRLVIEPDAGRYMDRSDRETLAMQVEASMWQLGYATSRDGARIEVLEVPDLPAYVASRTPPGKGASREPAGRTVA